MLVGIVMVITAVAGPLMAQDTATHKDSLGHRDSVPSTAPAPAPAPPTPTIEQIRYMAGLRTATRGVAQIRDGLNRVVRTQQSRDSLTRFKPSRIRSEEHTSELQSHVNLGCRLLLQKKNE